MYEEVVKTAWDSDSGSGPVNGVAHKEQARYGEITLPYCFSLMESFSSLTPRDLYRRKLLCPTNSCVTAKLARRFEQIKNVFSMTKQQGYVPPNIFVVKSLEVLGSKCAVLCVRDPYTHTHTHTLPL